MAFIAGYVAERPQPTEAILERVHDFSILPGESGCDYEQAVIATRFGHVIVKHKATYPIKPQIESDGEGNVLAMLGFVVSGDDARTRLARAVRTEARSLEECEGEFVAVFADAATGAVHIVNDRFSSRPLYTMRRGHGFYFSSNLAFLLALAQASYRPDVIGWLQVSTAGPHAGDQNDGGGSRAPPARHASRDFAGTGAGTSILAARAPARSATSIRKHTAGKCLRRSAPVPTGERGSWVKESWR